MEIYALFTQPLQTLTYTCIFMHNSTKGDVFILI